jgi:ABC-2 type transport system permease protein
MTPSSRLRESFNRIWFLIRREFASVWRDQRTRAILFIPPVLQLFLFTYAATFEINDVPIAVLNEDMGAPSRDFVARMTASPAFRDVVRLSSAREIKTIIDRGDVLMAVRIAPDFSRRLAAGKSADVQVIVDGRQSNTALIALSYINEIVERFSLERASGTDRARPPVLVTRAWFNPNFSSQWFMVPGLVASLTMIIATVITSLSIARERELGTLEQLLVTPLRPTEILIGKIIPAAVLGLAEGLALGILGVLVFDIPVRGELWLLVGSLIVFLMSVTSFGLMISALTATQQQAQIAAFCFIMPCVILSGFTTPVENMPDWIQTLTYANPLRYILTINRGVFLQDMPPGVVFDNLWPMAVIGVITAFFAMRMVSRRLQ